MEHEFQCVHRILVALPCRCFLWTELLIALELELQKVVSVGQDEILTVKTSRHAAQALLMAVNFLGTQFLPGSPSARGRSLIRTRTLW